MTATNAATGNMPTSIRAIVHQDAIQRVTRFFNATPRETLTELLQNARRAGASRVDITTRNGMIAIADDGAGIENPEALLAFGMSHWDDATTDSEDPAGMGVYSLAGGGPAVIRTHCPGRAVAWEVTLEREHFTGQEAAEVRYLDPAGVAPGSQISLPGDLQEQDIRSCTKHYPVPVYHNGMLVPQVDFLEDCFHIQEWRGLRIGVTHQRRRSTEASINFHGLTVVRKKPASAMSMRKEWNTLIDVVDCPDLKLTLPARKELVETDFVQLMESEALTTAYAAMLDYHEAVDVAFEVRQDAARRGITLPEARARLTPWQPEEQDLIALQYSETSAAAQEIPANALIMHAQMHVPDEHGLDRAATANRLHQRLYKPEPQYRGYEWYDRLPTISSVSVHCTLKDGQSTRFDADDWRRDTAPEDRVRTVSYLLNIVDRSGNRQRIALNTDLALVSSEMDFNDQRHRPLLTAAADISLVELSDLLMRAYFIPNEDADADSYNTQKEEAEIYLQKVAAACLFGRDEAVRHAINMAAREYIRWRVPEGQIAHITIKRTGETEVTVENIPQG